ncbi:decaprenyl-phosphate phosphoribosyltransferase [Ktedonobacter sp. SOSP1-85]|uniref:decaprenyl-phosphate phosphoribosyltransferase n=1 Tax=Ktedonobacter sp. SOSP1-85 TaxID=2778367 RepID=UPI001915550C|nr:decaprenyl-phosphate phosphoribosyltransferase [Ktedonobacter sp. SOSP1-85]GHO74021.1 decaprenyl-phosphate phosphoribosyltransferase [Ktedonobacter sp. SOSP1-85]
MPTTSEPSVNTSQSPHGGLPQLTAQQPTLSTLGRLRALLKAMRLKQWTKNATLFIAIVFASHLLLVDELERTILAFFAFCLASSTIYLLNDLLDIEQDRQHPVKCKRPLASGQLPASWAIVAIIVLVLLCAALSLAIFFLPITKSQDVYAGLGGSNVLFSLCVLSYLVLMVLYSIWLKHIVLIDIFVIACGFVLRVIAGAVVTPVSISPWLYMVTCLLSLFLALSKRRNELVLLQGRASSHRQILKEYNIPMLDQMITVVVTCTLMAYSLYTIEAPTGHHSIILTVPFVLYGIFRYLYLVYVRNDGGSPDEVLLRDRHMLITVLVCATIILLVFYLPH